MSQLFQFEQDFVASLRCIPMQVRLKLDTCGVKLKLEQWNHFTLDDRQQLLDRPCSTIAEAQSYRNFLHDLIRQRTGQTAKDLAVDPHPAWLNSEVIPDSVQTKSASVDIELSLEQWQKLQPLERFALIKLSRSNHENSNFTPALKEFGLI
ncbi:nitrate reductase associated protein [filamentous cyanobacterium LEGE 11480]|uniref:Nitrate reductase associated protein n=1 Tax=Romeriopsis navalis LEGE 11480 TaxID=2777977 RepID=A0A928VQP5_9CYAN|nr:nitrate reductase associated protein [Romeriopsis navalis]MBE9032033.1 nitrate reductase associated protein [Romeriopsis navalis LEGE 11480]